MHTAGTSRRIIPTVAATWRRSETGWKRSDSLGSGRRLCAARSARIIVPTPSSVPSSGWCAAGRATAAVAVSSERVPPEHQQVAKEQSAVEGWGEQDANDNG